MQALCIKSRHLQLTGFELMKSTIVQLRAHAALAWQRNAISVHQGKISADDNAAAGEANNSKANRTG